jgi:rSAM/selenodomain-associated transferase 2
MAGKPSDVKNESGTPRGESRAWPGGLSVIIPALNAAVTLPAMLAAVGDAPDETVLADGGSTDATRAIAEAAGARVLSAPRGRGVQLAAGAAAARGAWLLFLHADTRLAPGWSEAARATVTPQRAGFFALRFDDDARAARRVERLANWRARALRLPYGDQGLLIHRAMYEALGGFAALPLMEDVDLVRRLVRRFGRAALAPIATDAVTSAERYRQGGWTARPLRNMLCLTLWFAGVAPDRIARIYARR